MLMLLKKYFSFALLLTALLLGQPAVSMAQQKDDGAGFVDDSLKDMSIVLGSGAAGAVLGLSTLSFVDEPSKHLKNIAVGGAIGIVIGVGIVIFSQATRSTSTITSLTANEPKAMNAEKFENLSRRDFLDQKIVRNEQTSPNIDYNFSF